MTPATLLALADRCEAATGAEQRSWLEQAFYEINPAPEYGTDERSAWVAASNRFHDLIRAGAYLDAAMMLAPEGQLVLLTNTGIDLRHADTSHASALVGPEGDVDARPVQASTMPLALTAASLRAHAALMTGGGK